MACFVRVCSIIILTYAILMLQDPFASGSRFIQENEISPNVHLHGGISSGISPNVHLHDITPNVQFQGGISNEISTNQHLHGIPPNLNTQKTKPNHYLHGIPPNVHLHGAEPNHLWYGTLPNTHLPATEPNHLWYGTLPNTQPSATEPNHHLHGIPPNVHLHGAEPNHLWYGTQPNTHLSATEPNNHLHEIPPNLNLQETEPNNHLHGIPPNVHLHGAEPNHLWYETLPNTHLSATEPNHLWYGTLPNTHLSATEPNHHLHGISPNVHLHEPEPNHHLHMLPSVSHRNPNDPDLQVFFKTLDLKLGKRIPIYFPLKEPSKRPPLLSKEDAQSFPFSSSELPEILKFFSILEGSLEAQTMEMTIKSCEAEAVRGETRFCAASMESLLDSAHEIFRPYLDIKVTTTKFDMSKNPSHTSMLQNYTIAENPREILTPKAMACHILDYPYTIYYCHLQYTDHKIYKIPLVGDNGWKVEALGICHMDTSSWNPNHVAFQVLNTQPGKSSVCHFFSENDLVLFPSIIDV